MDHAGQADSVYAIPLLLLLRRAGMAGPATAVLIGILPATIAFLEPDLRFGAFALVIGLAVSLLFCRFAYSR